MKKICFITQSCFSQCDVSVFSGIKDEYEISWYVIIPKNEESYYSDEELLRLYKKFSLRGCVTRLAHRMRSLLTIWSYVKLLKRVRAEKASVYYVNAVCFPWFALIVRNILDPDKVIWAVHDVVSHDRSLLDMVVNIYKRWIYRAFNAFHFLSVNQMTFFEKVVSGKKKLFYAPHLPLFYGESACVPNPQKMRFLFFGTIVPYKGVDVLIRAAELLCDKGYADFEVYIYGRCPDNGLYESLMIHKDRYVFANRLINNSEIPDLFCSSHFLVLPYISATQSGPLSIARQYALPVIASDIPAFNESAFDRLNLFFPVGDYKQLAALMEKYILGGVSQWNLLRDSVKEQSALLNNASGESMHMYKQMFNSYF